MSWRAASYLGFTALLLEDNDHRSRSGDGGPGGNEPMEHPFSDMERHNRVPRGFLVFMLGLIAWGVYYLAAYTPEFSGWSQYDVLSRELRAEKAKTAAAAAKMMENPYEHDAKAVAEGKTIFAEKCADCHGADLKGGDGPPLTGHLKYGEQDRDKYESIAQGRPGGMPPFATELGRDRIWKVLAYVDSVREYGAKP
jgi:cytochrome c oxidase cbb3-type subunit 3